MLVQMQSKGRDILGLHIGKGNVRRHFPVSLQTIELELDHLRIRCDLQSSFWRDRPEITDPRLCAWLIAKRSRLDAGYAPEKVVMMRAGKASFRLQLASDGRGTEIRRSEKTN
jgi:hypothetical protein